jgi:hypothetical protein
MSDSPDKRGPDDEPASPEPPHVDSLRLTRAFQRLLRNILEKDDALTQKIRRRLLPPRSRDRD